MSRKWWFTIAAMLVTATLYRNRLRGYLEQASANVRDFDLPSKAGLAGQERDPVCGMRVDPHKALEYTYRGGSYHFCTESCREQFKATPEEVLRAMGYRS
jgi:YHS domain-containing protein